MAHIVFYSGSKDIVDKLKEVFYVDVVFCNKRTIHDAILNGFSIEEFILNNTSVEIFYKDVDGVFIEP